MGFPGRERDRRPGNVTAMEIPADQKQFCTACGAVVVSGSSFCTACGVPITAAQRHRSVSPGTGDQPARSHDPGIATKLGLGLAMVCAVVVVVVGAVVLWQHLWGPTVNAGQWFKANDIDYRVTVLRNNSSGLVVKIEAKNTEHSPHVTGKAVFEMVAHADGKDFPWDCEHLGCMGDELQPGQSRTYTFQFAVTSPADSLEWIDPTGELDPIKRVALIRLRPTS